MMYLLLAWRYAARRAVNYIAIAALALALAVQIVAMAVLDGMLVDLEKRLKNMGEQLTLRTPSAPTAEIFDRVAGEIVRRVPGVRAVTPLVQKVGFLEAGGGAEYVWVQGVNLGPELAHSSLAEHLLSYKPNPGNPGWKSPAAAASARPGLFMGEQLANRLGAAPGMEVELYFADRDGGEGFVTRSRRFVVSSLYRSGVFERDRYGIYIPIGEAADFYLSPLFPDDARDRAETFVLWLDDPDRAEALESAAGNAAKDGLRAAGLDVSGLASDTWQRRWAEAARGMRHENNLMELVLFLNDFASGFCVFAILVTLVSRRIRDVGLLRCIGASRRGVLSVFLAVGLIIGVSGGLLGVAGGCLLVGPLHSESSAGARMLTGGGAVRRELGANEAAAFRRPRVDRYYEALTGDPLFPPRMFGVASEAGLPVVIYPWKLAAYFAAAVLVSTLAALYPALWAAWREPMTALREG
ncbi:MAG: ABC transporter permease [Planctomycetota bacterium]|jgi:lipoprotein-releasing system permease protein|nr:ABC transporter permease [Planctomycetota bacterium]